MKNKILNWVLAAFTFAFILIFSYLTVVVVEYKTDIANWSTFGRFLFLVLNVGIFKYLVYIGGKK